MMAGMTADRSASLVGEILDGKYEVVRLVGEGAMGAVYEAVQSMIGRKVAVKVLRDELATSPDMMTRFLQEARVAGSLGHANICEVTDLGVLASGAPYLVMPLLEGRSLRAELAAVAGPLALERTFDLIYQVLTAVQRAHEESIVHRDLKPDNIFLTRVAERGDFVKILDFGISKVLPDATGPSGQITRTGMVLGTPYYMAPEQAHGDRNVDHRADIYAVGVILYELLTGERPFGGHSYNEIIIQIVTADFPRARSKNPQVPVRVEQVLQQAVAKDPSARWPSARDLKRALIQEAHVAGVPLPAYLQVPDVTGEVPLPGSADQAAQAAAGAQAPAPAPAPGGGATQTAGAGAPQARPGGAGLAPTRTMDEPDPGVGAGAGVGAAPAGLPETLAFGGAGDGVAATPGASASPRAFAEPGDGAEGGLSLPDGDLRLDFLDDGDEGGDSHDAGPEPEPGGVGGGDPASAGGPEPGAAPAAPGSGGPPPAFEDQPALELAFTPGQQRPAGTVAPAPPAASEPPPASARDAAGAGDSAATGANALLEIEPSIAMDPDTASASAAFQAPPSPTEKPRGNRRTLILLGVLAGAIALAGVWYGFGLGDEEPDTGSRPAADDVLDEDPDEANSSLPANLPRREVRITFEVTPKDARMSYKGRRALGHFLLVPYADEPFAVQFSAKGYRPKTVKVVPDEHRTVRVRLDPAPRERP